MIVTLPILLALAFNGAFGQLEPECGVLGPATNTIIDGDDVNALQFPWQISLQLFNITANRWEHLCSGSIVDKNWIFTTAHCLDKRIVNGNLRVVVGAHNMSSEKHTFAKTLYNLGPTTIALASIQDLVRSRDLVIHPLWNLQLFDYDYALIQFPNPLNFSGTYRHLRPICLPKAGQRFEGMDCLTSAWDLIKNSSNIQGQRNVSQKLAVHVPQIGECVLARKHNSSNDGVQSLTPRQICTLSKETEKSGLCGSDSGSPLQCKLSDRYVLAGAKSFARYYGTEGCLTIYARITEVLDWIERVKAIRTRN